MPVASIVALLQQHVEVTRVSPRREPCQRGRPPLEVRIHELEPGGLAAARAMGADAPGVGTGGDEVDAAAVLVVASRTG